MIDGDLQSDIFREARKVGQSTGFEIYSVIVSDNEIQYTWKREMLGRETLRHQFTLPTNELKSARYPLSLITDMFMRQAIKMQRLREMHEQP